MASSCSRVPIRAAARSQISRCPSLKPLLRKRFLYGTDIGYTDGYDTTEEFALMSRAGMNARQILASLTTSPVHRFRGGASGRIGRGEPADLVVLDADPAAGPAAFSKVRYTIRTGTIIYP